jgi:hypothetical protein
MDALDVYQRKPALRNASITGLQTGAAGCLVSAIQNALGQHAQGALGVLTRSGATIGMFGEFVCSHYFGSASSAPAALGASFKLTESFVANVRHTDDALNGASGACAAGFLAGIRSKLQNIRS